MKQYIGIDPGLGGGLGVISEHGGAVSYFVYDTPTVEVVRGGKRRREYGLLSMYEMMREVVRGCEVDSGEMYAVIEGVSPRPREGVVSAYRSGFGSGIWQALLTVVRISWRSVHPAVWKKAQGLIGGDKNYSRLIAQQRFPLVELNRAKDHGRAEALLIADYARRQEW